MKLNMKCFSSFTIFNDWKLLGAYYTVKSGGFLNGELRVEIHASYELLFIARVVVIVILSSTLGTPRFILNIGNAR